MRQSSTSYDKATPRARIAWRRAADELLIAAIFAEGVSGRDDPPARGMVPRATERKAAAALA